ncbi:M14 family zinc carboxypeptidase [Cellulomonas cellasea]|uniref:M14 family zinc carboxypeptidase n=1 Tax=Cellulomonas cellasea TaxID=43670 RepID=UPI0025A341A8|nr:M14 family zinc carboxypeptidase [Cellulomonas cellasea]MDM8084377.1 M14 family zinc carboxypeptidase [Cellulomonas cellasea]
MTPTDASAQPWADAVRLARQVPPIRDFPAVDALLASFDALVARHPGLASSRRIGTSRLGEPIPMVSIGHGRRQHLMFAGVHPNEPVGFRTLEHLARLLCEDDALRERLDATWHLVPCIDPDGTRLNEGWFAEPTSRTEYARRFYRPAPDEQVEWTFPFAHKDAWFDAVLPETQALMRVIDELRPDLMVSLHNSEMGGVYYYLTEAIPGAVEALHAVPAALGLPLDTGEAESPSVRPHAPGVYRSMAMADQYDYLESLGLDAAAFVGGDSSAAYAARHGTLTLVAELPYWSHPAAGDTTPTATSYRDAVAAKAAGLLDLGEALGGILAEAADDLTIRSPFLRASEAFIPLIASMGEHERDRAARPEADRPATAAEVFSNADVVHSFRLRNGCVLLRALDAEVTAGVATVRVRRLRQRLARIVDGWAAEADRVEGLATLDIARLVGVQLGATLAMARCLVDNDTR